jgi:hypothetical protein
MKNRNGIFADDYGEKTGGGGRSRTADAADMSRADIVANLLDLLTEILLEASVGDKSQSRAPPS